MLLIQAVISHLQTWSFKAAAQYGKARSSVSIYLVCCPWGAWEWQPQHVKGAHSDGIFYSDRWKTLQLTFDVSWWKLISILGQLDYQVTNAHNYWFIPDVWQFGIKQKLEFYLFFTATLQPAHQSFCILSKINQKDKTLRLYSVGSLCHLEAHWGDLFYAVGTVVFVVQGVIFSLVD